MKQNLYLFSNSVLKRRDNTLFLEALESKAAHEADIDESGEETLLLGKNGNNKAVKKKFIPAENVESVFTFGEMKISTGFLSCLSYYSIPMHAFSYYGKYLGTFYPKEEINSGNIVLAQAQKYFDNKKRIAIAREFITGAAENSISNLKYYSYRGVSFPKR